MSKEIVVGYSVWVKDDRGGRWSSRGHPNIWTLDAARSEAHDWEADGFEVVIMRLTATEVPWSEVYGDDDA